MQKKKIFLFKKKKKKKKKKKNCICFCTLHQLKRFFFFLIFFYQPANIFPVPPLPPFFPTDPNPFKFKNSIILKKKIR